MGTPILPVRATHPPACSPSCCSVRSWDVTAPAPRGHLVILAVATLVSVLNAVQQRRRSRGGRLPDSTQQGLHHEA
eukprot:3544386-Rhodomonas_salina.1